jgi:hypothetical protein
MSRFVGPLVLVLAGCAPAGQADPPPLAAGPASPAAAEAEVYVVEGASRAEWTPGWRAVIDARRILLDSPTSAGWYVVPRPEARTEGLTLTFAAPGLTLVVDADRCALDMDRTILRDRVTLDWDGGRFEGCGGDRPARPDISGSVWELVRIGGEAAPGSRSPAATLTFGPGGALGGTLACNDGGLRTRWTPAGGFDRVAGGFEQTAMGCNQPAAEAFGRRFWSGLGAAAAWRRDGDRLWITLGDGREAELRRLL